MAKTIYTSVHYQKLLDKICLSSAGPNPSIRGMKEKYWGKDAYVIKCGAYTYLAKRADYYRFLQED